MEKILNKFKRYIILFVLWLLIIVLALATVELALVAVRELLSPPRFLLDASKLFEVFSFALMLLIGLELIESVEIYLAHTNAKALVEPVILIAIIAIARKIIILDTKGLDPLILFGIAAIFVALAIGYFFVRRVLRNEDEKS